VLRNAYGLRLLATPTGTRLAAGIVVVVVVVFRLVQAVLTWPAYGGYDFKAYWLAGDRILHGQSIYTAAQLAGPYSPQGQDLFLYPPPFGAMGIPFAAAFPGDYRMAALLWSLAGGVLATAAMLALVRSERLSERFPILSGRGQWLVPLAAFAFPPVLGELVVGNVHLLLLAIYAFTWIQIRRAVPNGDRLAGIAIGIAAVIKIFPGVVLLWFLLVRRPRAFVFGIASALAAIVLTLPITGFQAWLDFPTMLLNMASPYDTTDALAPTVFLAPLLGFTMARVVVTVLGLVLVVWTSVRRPPAISFATTVLISVLIAPSMWHHYLTIAVVPMILGLGAGVSPISVGVTYLLLSGSQSIGLGDFGWITKRAFPLAGMAMLLFGLLRRGRSTGRPKEPSGPSESSVTAPAPG
jgi:alpha-1,2-mannosyltransferase